MKIAMIGTGYVGLVSGACFAEFGAEVVCVDVDADKIDRLNRGEMPIYEPELGTTVEKGVRGGRLSFTTDLAAAVRSAASSTMLSGPSSKDGAPLEVSSSTNFSFSPAGASCEMWPSRARPVTRTLPPSGSRSPAMSRKSVVFPAPFIPTRPTRCPLDICALAPEKSGRPPIPYVSSLMCSMWFAVNTSRSGRVFSLGGHQEVLRLAAHKRLPTPSGHL